LGLGLRILEGLGLGILEGLGLEILRLGLKILRLGLKGRKGSCDSRSYRRESQSSWIIRSVNMNCSLVWPVLSLN
jgi:hypothetical protein